MALAAVSGVFLARWLTIGEFGVFKQVSFAVFGATTLIIGDLGLSLALVRNEREPSPEVWRAALAFTLILALIALSVGAGAALLFRGDSTVRSWWFALLGPALATRFMRTVPATYLQRRARYHAIAVYELLETIAYFAVALTLAAAGRGVSALIIAIFVKEVVGSACFWALSGFRIAPDFGRMGRLVPLLRVGLPYQLTGLLTGSTDAFQPVVIGTVLGVHALGLVSWAYGLILMPILLLSAIDRVIVPSLSRVQSQPDLFARWTETAIRMNCIIAFPAAVVLVVSNRQLTVVVFGEKWLEASTLLVQFVPTIVAVALFTPVLQAFNAQGRTSIGLKLSVIWAAITWPLGTLAVVHGGIAGYGWFYIALQLTYLPIAYFGFRTFGVRVWVAARAPMFASFTAVSVATLAPSQWTPGALSLRLLAVVVGFVIGYATVGFKSARTDLRTFGGAILGRSGTSQLTREGGQKSVAGTADAREDGRAQGS